MVRLLVYSNDIDIEGLAAATSRHLGIAEPDSLDLLVMQREQS
jgi:hypothetical protein